MRCRLSWPCTQELHREICELWRMNLRPSAKVVSALTSVCYQVCMLSLLYYVFSLYSRQRTKDLRTLVQQEDSGDAE